MSRYGGNEDAYIRVLRSFSVNTRPLLEKMEKLLASGNLGDYTTAVHGIKGASMGIGAKRAGKDAERLETLSKSGKTEQTAAENELFIKYMDTLLDAVDNALAEHDSMHKKPVQPAPDPGLLQDLREACAQYDVGKVDRAMEQLDSFDYESGAELIAWLRGQVEDMNYQAIAEVDYNASH